MSKLDKTSEALLGWHSGKLPPDYGKPKATESESTASASPNDASRDSSDIAPLGSSAGSGRSSDRSQGTLHLPAKSAKRTR